MKTRLLISITFLLVTSLLLSGSVFAQKQQGKGNGNFFGGPPTAEEKLAHMTNKLGLSDQQAVDLLIVLQDKEQQRQALRDQTAMLMGPEICALMAETEEEILAILTPEQAEQFLLAKAERRANASGKGHKGNRMGPPDCSKYENGDG